MVDRNLFRTATAPKLWLPEADTVNDAGGAAYSMSDEAALAQFAVTGCLSRTFYADAETQLSDTLKLANAVSPEFLAKTAVYAREYGFMKDMPALLLAVLMTRSKAETPAVVYGPGRRGRECGDNLLERAFPRVIDNGKMLGNFVQIVRSGQVGRKSFGTRTKYLIQRWFETRSPDQLFRTTVGMSPSVGDVIKMAHPYPRTPQHAALFAYWIGKLNAERNQVDDLPPLVRDFEQWKVVRNVSSSTTAVPDVDFRLLTNVQLTSAEWEQVAIGMNWTATRMNLNTMLRHGVFENPAIVRLVAERLADSELVMRSRAFPYQLLMTYDAVRGGYHMFGNSKGDMPSQIVDAIQDALDTSLSNIPAIEGRVVICPDVSGSMSSPVTGSRGSATSKVSCERVAALFAVAMLRKNDAVVIPFDDKVCPVSLNRRDSVATITDKINEVGGGGTCISAPLAHLNSLGTKADTVIYLSDNESWVDTRKGQRATALLAEWTKFKARNPKAKMICIDLAPRSTVQAPDDMDILNIGGFSDTVFDIAALFARDELGGGHWVDAINKVAL